MKPEEKGVLNTFSHLKLSFKTDKSGGTRKELNLFKYHISGIDGLNLLVLILVT